MCRDMHGSNSRLAGFLPYRMAITSNAVSGLIADDYGAQFGLKIPEWRIMAVLGDAGPLTQRDLVRATLMDKVAVNRACKALDDRGFVRRSPNASDGRSHHLELTEGGRAVYEQIWPQAYAAYERIFTVLTAKEASALRDLLDKLLLSVRQIEDSPARRKPG
ncbi:MarR family winged helix-turn-helix transcriptional regulator [Novosphingobium sp. FSW06-99]|uniref:MarR family winged helix-turn-helix transcriptional regulator n=1 Tax=Novosphingobium sp. FSW06-99 TaxID=1739113 RepID=UPI00076CBAD4|nr:MarR family winged helix-turn-helix transcriptional regulator [Novosphingobium sp. FSW06-99]KUR73963.1 MarR family transcriptional regulator [Novosphingobium sp. FSW06-99]